MTDKGQDAEAGIGWLATAISTVGLGDHWETFVASSVPFQESGFLTRLYVLQEALEAFPSQ